MSAVTSIRELQLSAGKLSWSSVVRLGSAETSVFAHPLQRKRVQESYDRLEKHIHNSPVYGLNTHFGHNVLETAQSQHWESHQNGLMEFLSVGKGKPLESEVVRRGIRLQCQKLGLGLSGIHPKSFDALVSFSNEEKLPTVPCLGSLGASGDLISMSHALQPLFKRGLPYGPRDGLALVNTNSMMCSLAVHLTNFTERFLQEAIEITARNAVALAIDSQAFEPSLLVSGTHEDRNLLEISQVLRQSEKRIRENFPLSSTEEEASALQERYSIRCAPQILTAAKENLDDARKRVLSEAENIADNPVVTDSGFHHGGRFFTARLAVAVDLLSDTCLRIADLLDRQIHLIVTPELSHGLPPNLKRGTRGVHQSHIGVDHVKGVHQLVSACLQQLRGTNLPSSLMSAPAESYNQDVLPATMSKLNIFAESKLLLQVVSDAAHFVATRACAMRSKGEFSVSSSLEAWKNHTPGTPRAWE